MAKNETIYLPKEANISAQTFINSDSANTLKTIFTPVTEGSQLTGIAVTSGDTSARVAQLWITLSGTDYLLASKSIAAASGTDGSAMTVNLLDGIISPFLKMDKDGNRYINLESGQLLKASFTTQITSGKTITVTGIGGNY